MNAPLCYVIRTLSVLAQPECVPHSEHCHAIMSSALACTSQEHNPATVITMETGVLLSPLLIHSPTHTKGIIKGSYLRGAIR